MLVRGIRGATTVSQNTKTDIVKETSTLLSEMISANEINTEDIASIIFTTTFDVTLEFPAVAAREILSLNTVPLLNMHEINNPDGAFYIFPDVSYFFGKTIDGFEIKNSTDFSLFLLEKAHVATVTGEAFGSPNNIRISYAASRENIKKAIERIKSIF